MKTNTFVAALGMLATELKSILQRNQLELPELMAYLT